MTAGKANGAESGGGQRFRVMDEAEVLQMSCGHDCQIHGGLSYVLMASARPLGQCNSHQVSFT